MRSRQNAPDGSPRSSPEKRARRSDSNPTETRGARFTAIIRHAETLRQENEQLHQRLVELVGRFERFRNQVQEERERERERERTIYLRVFDLLTDPALITDQYGVIRDANAPAAALFGRSRRYLCGKPLASLIDLAERRKVRRLILDAVRGSETGPTQLCLRLGPQSTPTRILVAADRRAGCDLVWALHDASDIAAAEANLRESEARLRSIFEDAPDAIALNLLGEGTYLDANRAFESLSGFSREEILGRTPKQLGLWADRSELRTLLGRIRKWRTVGNLEIRIRRKDGQDLLVLFSATLITVEGRDCVLSFARDVTAERQTERELRDLALQVRERSRMAEIGAVVARVLHDVRNPLAGIQLNARGLLREIADRPASPLAEYAGDILTGVRRVEQILSAVSAFVRQRRPELSACDATDLVQRALALNRPLAVDHGVTLSSAVAGPMPFEADTSQLLRVLENLVRNAIEAIGDDTGTVQLTVSKPGPGQVRISVLDDGPGIPEGFDPFELFRTTKPEGTGLGLAIAREIAESHGGTLTFERLAPRGTAFHLDLPVDPNAASVARLPPSSERH